jgi:transposase InsO family protein
LTLDLYGPLPTGRRGVKYLFVCLDVFSKHVVLYPLKSSTTRSCLNRLKSSTTRSCLNRLKNDYFPNFVQPRIILSDHGPQFTSSLWKKTLTELNIKLKYIPIRNPESNPVERVCEN